MSISLGTFARGTFVYLNLLLVLFIHTVAAAEFYVTPIAGSLNDCLTKDTPCTLTSAPKNSHSIIHMAPGTYVLGTTISITNPNITFIGEPGVIVSCDTGNDMAFSVFTVEKISFIGINFTTCNLGIEAINSNYFQVQNCSFYGQKRALNIQDSMYFLLENTQVSFSNTTTFSPVTILRSNFGQIISTTINNCIATQAGESSGITISDSLNITIDRCIFANNNGSSIPTLLLIAQSPAPTIYVKNSHFLYNTINAYSSLGGAAVQVNGIDAVKFEFCNFVGNGANSFGGAVSISSGTKYAEFNNCNFTKNYAGSYGGGLYIERASSRNVTVFNSQFSENTAVRGGGIYTIRKLYAKSSNFTSNKGKDYSGAVFVWDQISFTSVDCLFSYNSAGFGGAFTLDNAVLYLINSKVQYNTASFGAGVYAVGDSTDVFSSGSIFLNNAANGVGGAIRASNRVIQVNNTIFEGNSAPEGGAVCILKASATFFNSSFISNTATLGNAGGCLSQDGSLSFDKVLFRSNNASKLNGGGIYASLTSIVVITNSNFILNTAAQGGGAIGLYSKMNITDTSFLSNSASVGGAIRINTNSSLSMTNSVFQFNRAAQDGGAISVYSASVTIASSSITENNALRGGGLFLDSRRARREKEKEIVELIDNKGNITKNTAQLAGGIYMTLVAEPLVRMSSTLLSNDSPFRFCCSPSYNLVVSNFSNFVCDYPSCNENCGNLGIGCKCLQPDPTPCSPCHANLVGAFCNIPDECSDPVFCDKEMCTQDYGYNFTCAGCKPGFAGTGGADCSDYNECENTTICDNFPNTECKNEVGNFSCVCKQGFISNRIECVDYNECDNGYCNWPNSVCNNLNGSYSCNCEEGYSLKNDTCDEINECSLGYCNWSKSICENTVGSYNCTCQQGYKIEGNSCIDVDECRSKTYNCSVNAYCNNTEGSYNCTCLPGYYGDGHNCTDKNECDLNPCNSSATCTNTEGSFTCKCKEGTTGDGFTCDDINECETGINNCSDNANCTNTYGFYSCSCRSGYTGDGYNCTDNNECDLYPCNNSSAICINTEGSFVCKCKEGTTGDGFTCDDINECEIGKHNCSNNANCTNTYGFYSCSCRSGFTGDGYNCLDIDECKIDPNRCGSLYCVNTIGNFICSVCPRGMTSAGSFCVDIDECKTNNGDCDYHTKCTNTNTSRICGPCPKGFDGNGETGCIPQCGNTFCESNLGENCVSCPIDCNKFLNETCQQCGDGFCEASIKENCTSCHEDCGLCVATPCPGTPQCSGHGTCNLGVCSCISSWSGPACDKDNTVIGIEFPDSDIGGVVITPVVGTTFTLTIDAISELDTNSDILSSISLKGKNFTFYLVDTTVYDNTSLSDCIDKNCDIPVFVKTNKSGQNKQWRTTLTLENGAFLEIMIWQFEEQETKVTFANGTTTYQANTVKIAIQIRNWPFKAIQNYIALSFGAPVTSESDPCGNTDSVNDENMNLKWFTLRINGVALYGQFLDRAVVDGLFRSVSFTLNKDNSVNLKIPHFWHNAVVDPSYSVLLADPVTDCEESEDKKNKSNLTRNIAIIVPVVVVGVAIVAALSVFVAPKIKSRWQVTREHKKLQRAAEIELNDNNNKIVVEKLPDMEVTTAAGTFRVRM